MEYNAMQVRFRLGPFTVIRSDAGVSLPAVLLTAALLPATAQAQTTEWPTKTVTVITPFAAGGNTDIMARLASQKLAQAFKQTFVVENRVAVPVHLRRTMSPKRSPTDIRYSSRLRRSLPCCRTCRRSPTTR